jgi:hypothetical protein
VIPPPFDRSFESLDFVDLTSGPPTELGHFVHRSSESSSTYHNHEENSTTPTTIPTTTTDDLDDPQIQPRNRSRSPLQASSSLTPLDHAQNTRERVKTLKFGGQKKKGYDFTFAVPPRYVLFQLSIDPSDLTGPFGL